MTSGKRVALIAIPAAAIAITAAVVFALSSQPATSNENDDDDSPDDGSTSTVESCDTVSGRVGSILASIEGIETEETRNASASLVDEYCQREQLVQEISAMARPAAGLVAYGCDAGSGRLGDDELQQTLQGHATIYCDNAFVTIFEDSEFLIVEVDDFREDLKADLEEDDNSTSTIDMEEVDAKLQEVADLANKAKSLLRSDRYYEAAQAYDTGSKMLDQLSSSY